jgi:Mn-containing catalase
MKMDCFDDIQIEEFSHFDFVEEMNESIEQDEKFDVNDYINSNYDY